MKPFFRFLSLAAITTIISMQAFAQSRTFTINSASGGSFQFSGTQEHDVYDDVYIQRTCSREVFSHYRRVCHDHRSEVCSTPPGGTRQCTPTTRRECHDVAQYRTEFYDCSYWTRMKVGTQVDYYVHATVNVKVKMPEGASAQEMIQATIDRNSGTIDFSAYRTTGQFLVYLEESAHTEISGNQKQVTVEATATLVPAAGIREAFKAGIQNFEAKGGLISFEMPTHLFSKQVGIELTVKRERAMWFGKELFSGDVRASALEMSEGTDKTRYTIDLSKLGLKEGISGEKEYKVVLKTEISGSALRNCLNRGDLGKYNSAEVTKKDQKL